MFAKCPKCDKSIIQPSIICKDGQVPMGPSWKTIMITCPYCHVVLGAQIDPIAIKTDIVNDLFKKLRG